MSRVELIVRGEDFSSKAQRRGARGKNSCGSSTSRTLRAHVGEPARLAVSVSYAARTLRVRDRWRLGDGSSVAVVGDVALACAIRFTAIVPAYETRLASPCRTSREPSGSRPLVP